MEYFRLRMDKRIKNPLIPVSLPAEYRYHLNYADFSVMEEAAVAYYNWKSSPEWCDIIFRPLFMFSNSVRSALLDFIPEDDMKLIFVLPKDMESSKITKDFIQVLWVPYIAPMDIIHADTVYDAGLIKKLVIDESKTRERDILHYSSPAEEVWIFSLRAMESLLATAPVGAVFELVESR